MKGDHQLLPDGLWHLQRLLAFPPSFITNNNQIIRASAGVTRAVDKLDRAAEDYIRSKMNDVFADAPTEWIRREMVLCLSQRFGIPIEDELCAAICIKCSEEEVQLQKDILALQQKKMSRTLKAEAGALSDVVELNGMEDD